MGQSTSEKPEVSAGSIVVFYESVDSHGEVIQQTYTAIEQAREWAVSMVGQYPEFGTGYAVSPDGVGKITCAGCSLSELFKPPAVMPTGYDSLNQCLSPFACHSRNEKTGKCERVFGQHENCIYLCTKANIPPFPKNARCHYTNDCEGGGQDCFNEDEGKWCGFLY